MFIQYIQIYMYIYKEEEDMYTAFIFHDPLAVPI